ncbi:MAG: IS21-like element helper ATPase IstB [Myxococcales bacterium]|nr:IS21-like element helper ATPase IstB [Myxococcales bacterium]
MRLGAMAMAWQQQAGDASTAKLHFDDRFGLLVEAEHLARDNCRLKRLLKGAELRISNACIEDVKISAKRGMDRQALHELGSLAWVGKQRGVLITGKTGVGKSYLACALGQLACRRGLRTLYRRMPRLLDELSLAKLEGTYRRVLAKLAKHELLIIDDLGLGTGLKEPQRQDLLEVLDDRYRRCSTIVTSQLPTSRWHEWIGDPTLADAILDRLVHNAHHVDLSGPSMREEEHND